MDFLSRLFALQPLPLFLSTPAAPATSVWWAPIRSPWPRWDTASSPWIRYGSLSFLFWGSEWILGAAPSPSTTRTRCYALHLFVCVFCFILPEVSTRGWVLVMWLVFLPPLPSVSLLPLRWNLMAKSGDCWEMNFRKRFHSFHNTVTLSPHCSPTVCLHIASAVALVGLTSVATYLSDQAHFF